MSRKVIQIGYLVPNIPKVLNDFDLAVLDTKLLFCKTIDISNDLVLKVVDIDTAYTTPPTFNVALHCRLDGCKIYTVFRVEYKVDADWRDTIKAGHKLRYNADSDQIYRFCNGYFELTRDYRVMCSDGLDMT